MKSMTRELSHACLNLARRQSRFMGPSVLEASSRFDALLFYALGGFAFSRSYVTLEL